MNERILYLIRGLSRSGKSTLARILAPSYNFASDEFFETPGGGYEFDPDKLGDAHTQCELRVTAAMTTGAYCIAVHNTFSEKWEAEYYLRIAEKYGYTIFVIECQNNFPGNSHNVPQEVTEKMLRRWQKSLTG